jgi:acylphosphatase
MMEETARLHAIVSGRVQGVGFRASTERRAREIGVTGRVRNRMDGTVEVLAEGAPGQIEALAAWLETGPPMARIDGVEASYGPARGEYVDFRVTG